MPGLAPDHLEAAAYDPLGQRRNREDRKRHLDSAGVEGAAQPVEDGLGLGPDLAVGRLLAA